jgi:DNA-binding LytR/AlgR family response regulator
LLAVTFAAAGALFAAAFGFGAVYAMRRTPSSLNLAALAATAGLQAVVENLRGLVHYLYPVHLWRVAAIWALAAMFAWLLAAYAATRFAPRRRPLLLGAATALIAASFLFGGFDVKTAAALLVGAGLAGAAAVIGVIQGRAQAWPTLAFLIVFSLVAMAAPEWFLDVSFFVMAAGLTLPLLILEVVRLGRDDRDREAALTRAASRPDRLAVATGKGVVLTPLAGIVVILGADDYADLRLLGGASLLHAARLDRLEAQLPGFFLRVHRSAIVNLNHVERLEREGGRWRLILAEGLSAPVSRSRVAAVRAALDSPAPVTGGVRTPAVAAWPGAKAR